jgi:hypothetical protein
MTGIYALIRPDGGLEFRDGVPDQMCKDTDSHQRTPAAFVIQRAAWGGNGLHGHVARTSAMAGDAYPPNRIASPLVAALGASDQYFFGNLTICGSRTTPDIGETLLCGLTEAQQRLIHEVHTTVSDEAESAASPAVDSASRRYTAGARRDTAETTASRSTGGGAQRTERAVPWP